ncbi:MAG: hypothetical protein NC489_41400, partial [Ruminococcus flavefaciens]|nr:hypothetical protein [Ruminococcus flavefaciens]
LHNRDKVNGAYTQFIIRNNRAANGGGIYTENNVELYAAQITGNSATDGGGIYTNIDNTSRAIQIIGSTVSGNTATVGSAIYMNRGKTSLNGSTVSGIIYKAYGNNPSAVFELKNALCDFSECEIRLSRAVPDEGLVLCEIVTGLTADVVSEPVQSYNVLNARAQFESGVGVKVYPVSATVTINYGGGQFQTQVNLGSFVLPEKFEGLPEDTYIEQYDIGGTKYDVGATYDVKGDFSVTATVKDYYEVTLTYGDYSETLLMRQNVVYYLPMKTPDGEVVFGWNCSDGKYYAYAEGVEIKGDTQLDAVIKQLHTVKISVLGEETEAKYEYGGSVTLPSPPAIFGKAFSHWEVDGKKYPANQTLTVTGDIAATAVYTDSWKVVTVVDDDEQTANYPNGYKLVLPELESSLGREFKYWLISGVKYYAGSTYTVIGDCEIIAVLTQVNAEADITVTISVNKGAIYDEEGNNTEAAVPTVETQATYKFNEIHTFTKPEVNDGNEFLYWDVNGVRYSDGATVAVKEPFTAIAVVAKISAEVQPKTEVTVTITNYVNGEYVTASFAYSVNTPLTLSQPVGYPEDKVFTHWLVNGVKYDAGAVITVEDDAEAVAVFADVEKPSQGDGNNTGNQGGKESGKGGNAGLIAGIVIAVVAVLGGGAAAAVIIILKKKKKSSDGED